MSLKTLHKVTGSILMNYMANHYNQEIMDTELYRGKLKTKLLQLTEELTKSELEIFDKVFDIDKDGTVHKLSSNLIDFIEVMLTSTNFPEFCKLQEIVVAFTLNPARIGGISDKILKENNEKLKQSK